MKNVTNSVLFTILSLLLIILTVPSCSNNVVDITTVSGPNETQCGGFDWQVKFKLKDKSPRGGWLIQEIAVVQPTHNCQGALINMFATHYWEAWRIAPNTDIWSVRAALGLRFDDRYSMPDRGRTYGNTNAVGIIKFFENVNLPPNFRPNNPNTYAHDLHSDTQAPPFWNTEDKFDRHDFANQWNCCSNPNTRSYTSTPPIGGVQLTPDQKLILNTPAGRLIQSGPAWTSNCGVEEAAQLREVAVSISEYPLDEVREGFAEFLDSTQNRNDGLDQGSKAYLLLRAIFDVPSSIPTDQAKAYGGWVRPNDMIGGETYNLQYPIQAGTENTFSFIGQYEGYLGPRYNALGEFDYFNENFERRRF